MNKLLLVLFLLCFAFITEGYASKENLYDRNRDRTSRDDRIQHTPSMSRVYR